MSNPLQGTTSWYITANSWQEQRRSLAADTKKLGFSAEVRRSAKAPHWICLATRRLSFSERSSVLSELWRVEKKNGGYPD